MVQCTRLCVNYLYYDGLLSIGDEENVKLDNRILTHRLLPNSVSLERSQKSSFPQ